MRAVKLLVAVMTALMVAGIVFLIYGLATGLNRGPREFAPVALDVPAPCRLAQSELGGDRLLLRLDGPREAGCQKALVVDLKSGATLGEVALSPTP